MKPSPAILARWEAALVCDECPDLCRRALAGVILSESERESLKNAFANAGKIIEETLSAGGFVPDATMFQEDQFGITRINPRTDPVWGRRIE